MVPNVTITHKRQVASLLPLGVEGALERSAICKDSYNLEKDFLLRLLHARVVCLVCCHDTSVTDLWQEAGRGLKPMGRVRKSAGTATNSYTFFSEKFGFGDPL